MASGPPRSTPQYSSQRLKQTNEDVNEIVGIMKGNVERVIQRDEKLSDLDGRAESLQAGAREFESTATRLKRKYWWQNLKMWILLIVIVVILIIIIIVWVTTSQDKKS